MAKSSNSSTAKKRRKEKKDKNAYNRMFLQYYL
jgi:hypothetical protein